VESGRTDNKKYTRTQQQHSTAMPTLGKRERERSTAAAATPPPGSPTLVEQQPSPTPPPRPQHHRQQPPPQPEHPRPSRTRGRPTASSATCGAFSATSAPPKRPRRVHFDRATLERDHCREINEILGLRAPRGAPVPRRERPSAAQQMELRLMRPILPSDVGMDTAASPAEVFATRVCKLLSRACSMNHLVLYSLASDCDCVSLCARRRVQFQVRAPMDISAFQQRVGNAFGMIPRADDMLRSPGAADEDQDQDQNLDLGHTQATNLEAEALHEECGGGIDASERRRRANARGNRRGRHGGRRRGRGRGRGHGGQWGRSRVPDYIQNPSSYTHYQLHDGSTKVLRFSVRPFVSGGASVSCLAACHCDTLVCLPRVPSSCAVCVCVCVCVCVFMSPRPLVPMQHYNTHTLSLSLSFTCGCFRPVCTQLTQRGNTDEENRHAVNDLFRVIRSRPHPQESVSSQFDPSQRVLFRSRRTTPANCSPTPEEARRRASAPSVYGHARVLDAVEAGAQGAPRSRIARSRNHPEGKTTNKKKDKKKSTPTLCYQDEDNA
jgi:hypothetical protein